MQFVRTLFCAAAVVAASAANPVRVEIFESLPAGSEVRPAGAPVETYAEAAFGFARIPTKFSPNALPLDRSTPYSVRATMSRTLPAGEYRFRLRAKGAAEFLVDGKPLLKTKAQIANKSGDDPVPPPVVHDNTPLRPAPFPHQDALAAIELAAGSHEFTMVAVIGGRGLVPSPGELSVSIARGEGNGKYALDRLLGDDNAPLLTDEAWAVYAARVVERHKTADVTRRREASVQVAAAWEQRHAEVREWLKSKPAPAGRSVDPYVNAKLAEAKMTPRPLTDDLEFLRRVSLDTIGLVPTAADIESYLADPPASRRSNAISRLLSDPGWADNWVSYWQDVLAENPGILKPDLNNTGPFRWWLHQSFADNIPFDRMVTELISMDGSATGGGPAGFAQATLNDAPMAAKADIVAQAFLGEKLSCARCHDAPFHPFQQKDLFSLAAMLSGKPIVLPVTSTVPVVPGGRKPGVRITLKPGESIAPEWPFHKASYSTDTAKIPSTASVITRQQVAAMLVSPENERFAQVIANRMWKRYIGLGIVEPADDWSQAKPTNPELLDFLARELLESGYNLKHVARLILSSQTYQRKPALNTDELKWFAGPQRRMMTAEQLVDSLHRSVGKPFSCEEMNLNPAGDRPLSQFLNMGQPLRAWELTALSNERDRPALALPMAQSLVDVLTTYGWRQSRQNAVTVRDDAPSPMQTLILANGILGTRIVRLADDSAFTELALQNLGVERLVREMFLRVLSREPSSEETRKFVEYLRSSYADRVVRHEVARTGGYKTDTRVSWSNHLSSEATLIRMEEERRLRMGDEPTKRLTVQFRERFEDALWAVVNAPEYVLIP